MQLIKRGGSAVQVQKDTRSVALDRVLKAHVMSTISQKVLRPNMSGYRRVEIRLTPRTFRVWEQSGQWRVSRDGAFYGDFLTRGDAVRAACFGARTQNGYGRTAEVIASPGDQRIPHFDPHFGE